MSGEKWTTEVSSRSTFALHSSYDKQDKSRGLGVQCLCSILLHVIYFSDQVFDTMTTGILDGIETPRFLSSNPKKQCYLPNRNLSLDPTIYHTLVNVSTFLVNFHLRKARTCRKAGIILSRTTCIESAVKNTVATMLESRPILSQA